MFYRVLLRHLPTWAIQAELATRPGVTTDVLGVGESRVVSARGPAIVTVNVD
jgi:hypothetical protein